jgi:hypothetical protein
MAVSQLTLPPLAAPDAAAVADRFRDVRVGRSRLGFVLTPKGLEAWDLTRNRDHTHIILQAVNSSGGFYDVIAAAKFDARYTRGYGMSVGASAWHAHRPASQLRNLLGSGEAWGLDLEAAIAAYAASVCSVAWENADVEDRLIELMISGDVAAGEFDRQGAFVRVLRDATVRISENSRGSTMWCFAGSHRRLARPAQL